MLIIRVYDSDAHNYEFTIFFIKPSHIEQTQYGVNVVKDGATRDVQGLEI